MSPRRIRQQESISNISMGLIESGLALLQTKSYPAYKRTPSREGPPFAIPEYINAGIAILLVTSGLDYHLARLKSLRDFVVHHPPLPNTPYFRWKTGAYLTEKIRNILTKRTQKILLEQLIEITSTRDSIVHPKLYTVKERLIGPTMVFGRSSAALPPDETHPGKTLARKRVKSEYTIRLRLPLVPTWVSYVDGVVAIMVINRFLNWLEYEFGNYYAYLGKIFAPNHPNDFFDYEGDTTRRFLTIHEWAVAFFHSLTDQHQREAIRRLGGNPSTYLTKRARLTSRYAFLSRPAPIPPPR